MNFDKWFEDNEDTIYDVTGGDWDDLVKILKEAFEAGVSYQKSVRTDY